MKVIEKLAKETFEKVSHNNPGISPDKVIDAFVLEYTKAVLFEATDVMRKSAADESPQVSKAMKVAVVDVLDHFGL
jgi:hypothetical protein